MFKYGVIWLVLVLILNGCKERARLSTRQVEAAFVDTCGRCHDLHMPPKTTADEKAPPMMAVAFHLRDSLGGNNPAETKDRFVAFVTDFVLAPSERKSLCDRKSLQSYGLMPSLKGQISPELLKAVAAYIYDRYDPQKYATLLEKKARLAALPPFKRVLAQKNCLGCHGNNKLAPSFKQIAERYADRPEAIRAAIVNGSRGKWSGYRLAMPPFADLSQEELDDTVRWILSLRADGR